MKEKAAFIAGVNLGFVLTFLLVAVFSWPGRIRERASLDAARWVSTHGDVPVEVPYCADSEGLAVYCRVNSQTYAYRLGCRPTRFGSTGRLCWLLERKSLR